MKSLYPVYTVNRPCSREGSHKVENHYSTRMGIQQSLKPNSQLSEAPTCSNPSDLRFPTVPKPYAPFSHPSLQPGLGETQFDLYSTSVPFCAASGPENSTHEHFHHHLVPQPHIPVANGNLTFGPEPMSRFDISHYPYMSPSSNLASIANDRSLAPVEPDTTTKASLLDKYDDSRILPAPKSNRPLRPSFAHPDTARLSDFSTSTDSTKDYCDIHWDNEQMANSTAQNFEQLMSLRSDQEQALKTNRTSRYMPQSDFQLGCSSIPYTMHEPQTAEDIAVDMPKIRDVLEAYLDTSAVMGSAGKAHETVCSSRTSSSSLYIQDDTDDAERVEQMDHLRPHEI